LKQLVETRKGAGFWYREGRFELVGLGDVGLILSKDAATVVPERLKVVGGE
jgi:hypothetical protein